jgi:hypothetical protein
MKKILVVIAIILFLSVGLEGFAQGNSGNGNGKGKQPPVPFGPPHPELPIDGALSILLLAGACYGAFNVRLDSR